jgi:hypothetical protein
MSPFGEFLGDVLDIFRATGQNSRQVNRGKMTNVHSFL